MRPNSQETVDLITFTEEILNGKLHFLCSVDWGIRQYQFPRNDSSLEHDQAFFLFDTSDIVDAQKKFFFSYSFMVRRNTEIYV